MIPTHILAVPARERLPRRRQRPGQDQRQRAGCARAVHRRERTAQPCPRSRPGGTDDSARHEPPGRGRGVTRVVAQQCSQKIDNDMKLKISIRRPIGRSRAGAGTRGTIVRIFGGTPMFHVYCDNERFTDYAIRHDDLSIIDKQNYYLGRTSKNSYLKKWSRALTTTIPMFAAALLANPVTAAINTCSFNEVRFVADLLDDRELMDRFVLLGGLFKLLFLHICPKHLEPGHPSCQIFTVQGRGNVINLWDQPPLVLIEALFREEDFAVLK